MRELTYSIKPAGQDAIEVRAHGVKYVLKAPDKSSFELAASKGDTDSKHAARIIKGNVVEVEIADQHGLRVKLKTTFGTRTVRTEAVLGRKRYHVNSRPNEHAAALARAFLGSLGPDARYIRWFNKDMRQHPAFRRAVRVRLPGLGVLNGGPGHLGLHRRVRMLWLRTG